MGVGHPEDGDGTQRISSASMLGRDTPRSGSAQGTRRRASQQRSQQAQATNTHTSKNWSRPRQIIQAPTTVVQSLQGAPCCSRAAPNWQPWRPVPLQCRLKTLPAGRSPCWTATQTLDEERSLHQWRSIQEQYWFWLQKVQHNIQSALNKRRDSGRILKQMKERPHNIAQDMYILNRSCGEEIVRSSLARARKAAPEKRRRARRRNRVRRVKQACSDTIEKAIS